MKRTSVGGTPAMYRPRTVPRRALALVVAGALLLLAAQPISAAYGTAVGAYEAMGQPHLLPDATAAAPVNVTVSTNDSPAFAPSTIAVLSGENLSITLVNHGSYAHTFTLSSNGSYVLPKNWTPQQLDAFFQAQPPLLNVSMPANSSSVVNLTVNASMAGGHFEYVSVVPYQFQAGMAGFLNVTPPVQQHLEFYVNASDTFRFLPSQLNASASLQYPISVTVELGLASGSAFSHTFTLSPLPNYNLSSANYTTFFSQHAPLVSIDAPATSGPFTNGTFVIDGPGYYEYICEITGHFADGMFGFLYVGVPLPALPTAPSTAIVDEWLLIGGAVVLGIGAILAAVVAFVGRFPPPAAKSGGHS